LADRRRDNEVAPSAQLLLFCLLLGSTQALLRGVHLAKVASELTGQESQKPCEFAGWSNDKQAVDHQKVNP
jgi:hypothetical protein